MQRRKRATDIWKDREYHPRTHERIVVRVCSVTRNEKTLSDQCLRGFGETAGSRSEAKVTAHSGGGQSGGIYCESAKYLLLEWG